MGSALVTGASSGLGLEIAWNLAAEGNNLVLVARSEQKLQEVARRMRDLAQVQVEVMAADLSKAADVERVAQRLRSTSRPIGLLVNNAGFGLGAEFLDSTVEREDQAIDVMIRAVMVLSHTAARVMRSRGRGGILNVSSIAALTAQGTYSAAKAWLRTFTEGLAAELKGTGVHVTAVTPGLIRTNFHAAAGVDSSQWPRWYFATPQKVADVALNAVRRGTVIVTPTPMWAIAAGALRMAPRWIVRKVAGPTRSGISAQTVGLPQ
ncbi:MAG: SDR family oxidoreductase [Actinomycetaceae bacterium]|nr:SDR family oxidoreductase [Actinomycetaceae bacterium]MDY6083497.1 SDR family oxidoreductase [Actinomycetaceae bacterium]